MSHLKFYFFIHKILKTVYKNICDLFSDTYKNTKIVRTSNNFIIIDKAYDLKINSNNKNEETIQTFMKKNFPYLASNRLHHEYYFMHRLDYSTSGLMCIPIHKEACQVASKAIQQRKCKKYYIALVRGYLSLNLLDLNFPIGVFNNFYGEFVIRQVSGRDNSVKEVEKMCVTHGNSSRTARTLIVVLENGLFENYPSSKILIRPITGRRHQIRVHCSHIGHTIVGDYTYSNKKDTKPERMYLHSLRLVIPNKIEDINDQTSDPFSENEIKSWKPVFRFYNLSRAFKLIDEFV